MSALNVSFLPLSYAMLSTFNFVLVINVSSGRAFSPVSTSIGCGTMSPDLEVDIGGVDVNVGLACAPERHLGVDGGVRLAPVALCHLDGHLWGEERGCEAGHGLGQRWWVLCGLG